MSTIILYTHKTADFSHKTIDEQLQVIIRRFNQHREKYGYSEIIINQFYATYADSMCDNLTITASAAVEEVTVAMLRGSNTARMALEAL